MCSAELTDQSHGQSLRANTAWSVVGNLVYTVGRILIVIIITRNFTSKQVGQVIFALAVVTPLSYLINMELRSVFVTDSKGQIAPGHCLASRVISNILLLGVLAGICLAGRNGWGLAKAAIIFTAGGVRAAESWADVYMGVFQKRELMKRWAISQGAKTGLVLIWVALLAYWTDDIIWMLIGWLGATVLVTWFYDRPRASKLMPVKPIWDISKISRLCKWGFPLGVFVTLAILNHQVAQYFINYELGDAQVAYFGVLMIYVNGASTLQNGVNQSVLGRLARYFAEGNRQFRILLAKVLGGSWLVMGLGLAVIGWQGREILRLLHGQEYAQYAPLFLLIMTAGALLLTGMILGDAVVACRRYKSRMYAVAAGLTVNVLICFLFIGEYGISAAAWAVLASAATVCLICGAVLTNATMKHA